VTARPIVSDPDTGIPDLIRRLTDDSKRLVTDEVQLAKMETKDSLHRVTRGVLWMGLAFGAGIVMLVALTLFLVTLIGRLANDHMWVGALVTGLVELGLGGYLVKKGIVTFAEPSYTLEHSRSALKDTADWARTQARS
jgi:sirohydrochlorin ferrochelatase